MQKGTTRPARGHFKQASVRPLTVTELVDMLGIRRGPEMIKSPVTEEEREWEQKRLAEELERVPTLAKSPFAGAAPRPKCAIISRPSPWNYDFTGVSPNLADEKADLENKLCLKYRELVELKADRDRAERGIVRCQGEIDAFIEKMKTTKSS